MSTREQLAEVIRDGEGTWRTPLEAADAILGAGYAKPRTITTVEELDALPPRSVIKESLVCIKWGNGAWGTFSGDSYDSSRIDLPATVLYSPEVGK